MLLRYFIEKLKIILGIFFLTVDQTIEVFRHENFRTDEIMKTLLLYSIYTYDNTHYNY